MLPVAFRATSSGDCLDMAAVELRGLKFRDLSGLQGVWGLKFKDLRGSQRGLGPEVYWFKALDLGCMEVMENQIERKHEMDRDLRARIRGFGM